SCIRRLPRPGRAARLAADRTAADPVSPARSAAGDLQPQSPAPVTPRRPVILPLAPERYQVQFTASAETHAKLVRAQALLRSQMPHADVGEVIDRALTALLNDLEKKKFAATDRPRERGTVPPVQEPSKPAESTRKASDGSPSAVGVGEMPGGSRPTGTRPRHIPAEVKRAVWARDGGQCAFVGHNGRRCSARVFLEFHHVVPYAAGGEATVGNIQLRCRAHNGYEAEVFFGHRRSRPENEGGGQLMTPVSTGSGPSSSRHAEMTHLAMDGPE
ncbi:MAG: hypothetical protein ACRDF6_08345, partial [bacterium]